MTKSRKEDKELEQIHSWKFTFYKANNITIPLYSDPEIVARWIKVKCRGMICMCNLWQCLVSS